MKSYLDKLKDPRWQKKRLEVFERDGWTCQLCKKTEKTLNVHHRYYKKVANPWDYPLEAMVTLCEDCHEEERQAMPQEERLVLACLKSLFYSSEMHDIGFALSGLKIVKNADIFTKIFCWAVRDKGAYKKIIKEYKKSIKK